MGQFFEKLPELLQARTWLIYLLSVSGIAIIISYACHILCQKVYRILIEKKRFTISALLQAVHWPLVVFIWVKALASIIDITTSTMNDALVHLVWKMRDVGSVLFLAWVSLRFIRLFEEQLLLGHLAKRRLDETMVYAIGKLIRVIAGIIVILFILPMWGIDISGIVAFGGGSALALGIGAQGILANYLGGLVIYADRNFKVGDWIYSPEKDVEGTVEHIGWRVTQIRTFDKRVLYVPNAAFSSIIVVNASRMTNRRIQETLGIRYTDAAMLDRITQEIRTMLQEHPDIDQRQALLVHFTGFGPFSLKISIYIFTKTVDLQQYRNVRQNVFLEIIQIIENNGAALALPINTVYLNPKEHVSSVGINTHHS